MCYNLLINKKIPRCNKQRGILVKSEFTMSDSTTKTCTKCHQEFPATREWFYSAKRQDKILLRARCKKCTNQENIEWGRQHPDKRNTYTREFMRRDRIKNPEKHKASYRKWANKNRESLRAYDRWRSKNVPLRKQQHAETKRKWRELHPELQRERGRTATRRREARKPSLPHDFTAHDWEVCLDYFDYKCAYCGKQTKLTQDHIMPVSKDGGYMKSNIVPACQSCNSSKSDKNLEEWVRWKFTIDYEQILDKIVKYISSIGDI